MCGIVGYVGHRQAAPIIVEGLKKLEYRGYDSFGVATISDRLEISKHQGRIADNGKIAADLNGRIGIGHTRWATHGIPNEANAHPHTDCSNRIAVVHNGIIENYAELKRQLIHRGHTFRSDTDTEIIVHLIEENYVKCGNLLEAVQITLPCLIGSFAILVIMEGDHRIIAAKRASPLVLGVGDREFFAASDMTPLIEYTERAIFLEEGDVAEITPKKIEIYNNNIAVKRDIELVDLTVDDVKKADSLIIC